MKLINKINNYWREKKKKALLHKKMKAYQHLNIKEKIETIPSVQIQEIMKKMYKNAEDHIQKTKKDARSVLILPDSTEYH